MKITRRFTTCDYTCKYFDADTISITEYTIHPPTYSHCLPRQKLTHIKIAAELYTTEPCDTESTGRDRTQNIDQKSKLRVGRGRLYITHALSKTPRKSEVIAPTKASLTIPIPR